MWGTRFLKTAFKASSFTPLSNSFRSLPSVRSPIVNDCTFMQLKSQMLVPNFFLHNVRELLERMSLGDETSGLIDLMELSLINQSKLGRRIILKRNGCQ